MKKNTLKTIIVFLLFGVFSFAQGPKSNVTDVLASRVERPEQLNLYTNGNHVYSFGIGTENDLLLEAFQVNNNLAFGIDRIADRIVLRRNGNAGQSNGQERHILFFEKAPSFGGNNKDFRGGFFPTMEEAMVCTCINRGADNVFANSGGTNINNIQRLDYIFDDGIVVPNNPEEGGFPIFERGGNDPFKLAVIKDVNQNGDPSEFGTVHSYLASDWTTTGYSINSAVLSGFPNNGGNLIETANLSSQNVAIVFVSFADLGLSAGDIIYGYSLAGADATSNSTNFLNFTNTSHFPTNTNEANGGIDLLSGGSFSRKAYIHAQSGWYQGVDPNSETTTCDDLLTVSGGEAPLNSDAIFKEISAVNGSINLNGNTVEVCENLNTRFPFKIHSGVLKFSGSSMQKIRGDRNLLSVDVLEVDNSFGLEVTSPVEIFDILKLTNGDVEVINDFIFRCGFDDAGLNSKTAIIGQSAGTLIGNVTTEQCYPGRRAFRFVSPSVTTTTSIRANWQEGANAWNDNPTPGYGTHITGLGVQNPTPTNDSQNGFDWQPSGNPSMFAWNNATTQWSAINNTDSNTLTAGQVLRLNIRGSRAVDIRTNTSPTSNTILREIGEVQNGTVTFNEVDLGINSVTLQENDLILVGNPFQSIVDLNQVIASSTGVKPFVAIWDPRLGGVSSNVNQNSTELGGRGSYLLVSTENGATNNPTSAMNQLLQPKQALFFYKDDTGAPVNIVFEEFHKIVDVEETTTVFSNLGSHIQLSLFDQASFDANDTADDGIKIMFNPMGNNLIDQKDVMKLSNQDENLARMFGNQLIGIEERNMPEHNEVLPLFINNYRKTDYVFTASNIDLPADTKAYLRDNYLDTFTELEPGQTVIPFSIDNTINASKSFSRFAIVFEVETFSIQDFDKAGFALYPNPVVSNEAWISASSLVGEKVNVRIYDVLGRKVASFREEVGANGQIHLTNLSGSAGVYMVELTTAEKKFTTKYIKK